MCVGERQKERESTAVCLTLWACVFVQVILGFLLTAAGCRQIYSAADAARGRGRKGHISVLSVCSPLWGHLFMDQGYTMWIGRLSKAALGGSKTVFGKRSLARLWASRSVLDGVVVVSLLGHPHYQACTGRHGWFLPSMGHVGSWEKREREKNPQ